MSNQRLSVAARSFALLFVGALTLASGCTAELGISGLEGQGHLTILPGADGGSSDAGVDAYWAPPDAYVAPGCAPACAGRQCGSDGCGGSCGSCGAGSTCSPTNQCVATPPAGGGGGGTHAVTVYGTSTCGYCRRAREFFTSHDVSFADRNLEDSAVVEEAFNRVHDLTGEYRVSTPTVIIDDQVMLGWSEAECTRLLGL